MNAFSLLAHLVDVVSERIMDACITVEAGRIAAIEPVDGLSDDAPYILPGFVDSHIHIESTLLTPDHFACLAVRQGTVGAVTDPHEIANVLGVDGVNYMLRCASRSHFHFAFGVPSCVPSTPFETAGAALDADAVSLLLARPDFYGLAEMMNFPGVLGGDEETMKKVRAALALGKVVDGHAPAVVGDDARRYVGAGITTDHEVFDLGHARERLALGMKIQIREGSAACNFETLAPLLSDDAYKGMLMFCSDDIYPSELRGGHINRLVARAVAQGFPLWNVLHAACVAPVRHYSMPVGLLRVGDNADFVLVDNLSDFNVVATYIDGEKVYCCQTSYTDAHCPVFLHPSSEPVPNNFHARKIQPSDIEVSPSDGKMKVIVATDGQLFTRQEAVTPLVRQGRVVCDLDHDVLKLVVCNRYQEAPPAVAFIKGFALTKGAIASTIAHDCHNIIAVGTNDNDMVSAVNALVESRGGICAVDGDTKALLPLPVAGLMSTAAADTVADDYLSVLSFVSAMGCPFKAPFMTLSFMALPVIPELKLTDKGLFDGLRFAFTSLFVAKDK